MTKYFVLLFDLFCVCVESKGASPQQHTKISLTWLYPYRESYSIECLKKNVMSSHADFHTNSRDQLINLLALVIIKLIFQFKLKVNRNVHRSKIMHIDLLFNTNANVYEFKYVVN